MKVLLALFLLNFSLIANENWRTDFKAALAESKEQGKAILIDFYADWCGPCKAMNEATLKDELVLSSLKDFILIKVDIDKNQQLAKEYRVSSIPHFTILNRHHEITSEVKGYKDAANFSKWIRENSDQALSEKKLGELNEHEEKLLKEFPQKPADNLEILQIIHLNSPPAKQQALMQAMQKLTPKDLKNGLTHKKLAVRLLAATLINAQLEKPMSFDPWGSPEERQKQLEGLAL
ncbi:MAG: thioredoxin domain-containing protein [Lentisphaerales bacterium]|nr:thioredoxin domain-containing protein [Lentisphaerales bacterium]